MRKLISFLVFVLFAPYVHAQCSNGGGTPQAWSCLAGTTVAQLQAAYNTAADGAVFTFAPGNYAGGRFLVSPTHGVTFICGTPPIDAKLNITSWAITSNVVTFQAPNSLVAGQIVGISGFTTSNFLNYPMVVLATGLSSTQFEANFTHANGSATESGIATVTGAALVNPCTITSTGSVFGSALEPASGVNTHLYRFSGFQITGNVTGHFPFYFCDQGNCNGTMTQIRIDHCTVTLADGSVMFFGVNGTSGNIWGVLDHNIMTSPGSASIVEITSVSQTSGLPSSQLGTIQNMFVEDDIILDVVMQNSSQGCSDGWGSGAFVFRHSQSLNCLWTMHGTTHGGGPYNVEFYNMDVRMDSHSSAAFANGNRSFHSQGAGTFMGFNNTVQQIPGNSHGGDPIEVGHYPDVAGLNGHYPATAITLTGTTAVFNVSGIPTAANGSLCPPNFTQVAPDCATHGWYNMSGFVNGGNNSYIFITSSNSNSSPQTLTGSITSSLGNQVTESGATAVANFSSIDGQRPQCDGTVTTSPWLDGNRAPITTNRGYPCWHQPGRDVATGNLQPMYAWNNRWNDDGSQANFNLADLGAGQPIDYYTAHLQYDRDAEQAVSNLAQTNPTTPFNGTTGMGFGTLANRPTTCTTFSEPGSGVGYFATDVGPQGTLFRCSATNVWSIQYVPFTYPHPLVSGPAPPTPAPTTTPFVGIQKQNGVVAK